jgi:hypothetical protein
MLGREQSPVDVVRKYVLQLYCRLRSGATSSHSVWRGTYYTNQCAIVCTFWRAIGAAYHPAYRPTEWQAVECAFGTAHWTSLWTTIGAAYRPAEWPTE